MISIETIGLVAAVTSTLTQLPQAIKTIRSRDTHSLSLWMYILVWVATALWLLYGFLRKDTPLILSNCISIVPITYILIAKIVNTLNGKDKRAEDLLRKNR